MIQSAAVLMLSCGGLDRASDYYVQPGGYSLHQEVLSVIAALEEVGGPISYGQAQRDQIIQRISCANIKLNARTFPCLLDEVVNFPGAWGQNCEYRFSPPSDWLPLYGFRREWTGLYISEENFARLRDEREAVVGELRVRIPGHLAAAVRRANERQSWERWALETYLVVVQDLNAVETLPALLQMEEALSKVPAYEARGQISEPCDHVEVLSTITCILRNENAGGWQDLQARYSRDSRDRIVETARRFLEATAPWDYRAAGGMATDYRYR